ncbi:uncharacterized protein K452DRAFT_286168 [Aplosporella prunicola CBS 121167]|uniref:DUF8004 domain-containing protein n=1 Tax=Aplosporella prunicola CBS 121167 TaxID=1176127 RepID=A0A6A6BIU2_9PEZI|nr:uncharacterized protein K452DRAFT_286168 [Aplosporella prunicola CBS 121167]KAF2143343.1 hypothetical protein K452DRAFT_286168 [Aplosporella prunicola CBS 121167]
MSSRAKRITSIFSLSSSNLADADKQSTADSDTASTTRGRRASISASLSKRRASRASVSRDRSSSAQQDVAYPEPPVPPIPDNLSRKSTVLTINTDNDSDLLPPPPVRVDSASRSSSPIGASRPGSRSSTRPNSSFLDVTSDGLLTPSTPTSAKLKRKSIFGNRHSKASDTASMAGPLAWVCGHQGKPEYNLSLLLTAEKVPELWDENGDTYIHLFPRSSGKGPSFRVDSTIYSSASVLTKLAYGGIYSNPAAGSENRKTLNLETQMQDMNVQSQETPPESPAARATPRPSEIDSSEDSSKGSRAMSDSLELPKAEIHLYIPLSLGTDGSAESKASPDDVEALVGIRNMFSFLVGQSLVATNKRPSIFAIFMGIAEHLQSYEFSNIDGSTFGEVAATSFDNYVEELHLGDVRTSREKTIEGIILGEKMRSVMLFNEAFVHAAGKYEQITALKSPKFQLISQITQNRLERASMDLDIRQRSINGRIADFNFPAIFSGIMNSKTTEERKHVRFEAWRKAYEATRKNVISYYKNKYGAWPPKASSKKNTLETSGLNRLVLQDLYTDFSCWYDLLVDRENLTTRTLDSGSTEDEAALSVDPITRALRHVLSEYDRSIPPVQPPAPFDVPIIPSLSHSRADYGNDEKKDTKARKKTLKDDEIATIMKQSHNADADISNPFLDSVRNLEKHAAHRKNIDEITELRIGQWLLMYAVLQSLPMLVIDAPGVKWSQGVEYFLCEPPRSGVPWAREDRGTARSWYGIAGGAGVVSLPSDLIEHGVEGVYRRSHCWRRAEQWTADQGGVMAAAVEEDLNEPLPAPGMRRPRPGSRTSSSSSRMSAARESVMMLGLEALPLPAGVAPTGEIPRPTSSSGTATFDDIIGAQPPPQKGKKREKSKLAS